ncbi:MAG: type 1 glutamine amidotransferase [Nitrospinae bacterium]|nr:type 1 glutamine amidotransferase [Nitrospinota bacterium]
MKIHTLQHVPFEGPANFGEWFTGRGHTMSYTHLYERAVELPALESFDFLLIMGGSMSVNDEGEFPWLVDEKRFVEKAINAGKTVVGVCLGAQLIANVLGSRVYRNREKEIGWFPLRLTEEGMKSRSFKGFSAEFTAFHWHGETFDIPSGAVRLAESSACANQAFEYEGRVVGLQFHLETNESSAEKLIENCGEEIRPSTFIQSANEMMGNRERFEELSRSLDTFLGNMA